MPSINLGIGMPDHGKNNHTTTIQISNFSQSSIFSSDLMTSMSRDARNKLNFEATTNLSSKHQ